MTLAEWRALKSAILTHAPNAYDAIRETLTNLGFPPPPDSPVSRQALAAAIASYEPNDPPEGWHERSRTIPSFGAAAPSVPGYAQVTDDRRETIPSEADLGDVLDTRPSPPPAEPDDGDE